MGFYQYVIIIFLCSALPLMATDANKQKTKKTAAKVTIVTINPATAKAKLKKSNKQISKTTTIKNGKKVTIITISSANKAKGTKSTKAKNQGKKTKKAKAARFKGQGSLKNKAILHKQGKSKVSNLKNKSNNNNSIVKNKVPRKSNSKLVIIKGNKAQSGVTVVKITPVQPKIPIVVKPVQPNVPQPAKPKVPQIIIVPNGNADKPSLPESSLPNGTLPKPVQPEPVLPVPEPASPKPPANLNLHPKDKGTTGSSNDLNPQFNQVVYDFNGAWGQNSYSKNYSINGTVAYKITKNYHSGLSFSTYNYNESYGKSAGQASNVVDPASTASLSANSFIISWYNEYEVSKHLTIFGQMGIPLGNYENSYQNTVSGHGANFPITGSEYFNGSFSWNTGFKFYIVKGLYVGSSYRVFNGDITTTELKGAGHPVIMPVGGAPEVRKVKDGRYKNRSFLVSVGYSFNNK